MESFKNSNFIVIINNARSYYITINSHQQLINLIMGAEIKNLILIRVLVLSLYLVNKKGVME